MEKQKENLKSVPPKPVPKEARYNVFANAKSMLLSSVGRLPTALVVILLISLAMAAVTGLVLQLNRTSDQIIEFMPLRLEPAEDAVPLDQRKIQGTWVYQASNFAMTLTLIGDRFEWIIVLADVQEAQFFARGNFKILGDVMILGVRPDLGKPGDPAKPWMKYMPIAMKDLNAKFKFEDRKIIWNIPSSEQRKIVGQSASIFAGHEDGHFEWVKQ